MSAKSQSNLEDQGIRANADGDVQKPWLTQYPDTTATYTATLIAVQHSRQHCHRVRLSINTSRTLHSASGALLSDRICKTVKGNRIRTAMIMLLTSPSIHTQRTRIASKGVHMKSSRFCLLPNALVTGQSVVPRHCAFDGRFRQS